MDWLAGFQAIAAAVFTAILAVKICSVAVTTRRSPLVIGQNKPLAEGTIEWAFSALVVAFLATTVTVAFGAHTPIIEFLSHALGLPDAMRRVLSFCYARILPNTAPLTWLGVAIVVAAFVILVLAYVAVGPSWRIGIDNRSPGALVTSGIYSVSRNPIYVFFHCYVLGTFLINGLVVFLLFLLLQAVILHLLILAEERHLLTAHGAAYELYRRETGRYCTLRYPRRDERS